MSLAALIRFNPRSDRREKKMPKKVKVLVTLASLMLIASAFFDEDQGRRNLACMTIPDIMTGMSDEEVRELHEVPSDPMTTLHERLLELGIVDPCLSEQDGKSTTLKCKTVSEFNAEMGEKKLRNLIKGDLLGSRSPYEKLLEIGSEKPCVDGLDLQRALHRCKTIPELIAEMSKDDFRKLHLAQFDSKTLYERILEVGEEDRCLTDFPSQIIDIIDVTIEEPSFDVASDFLPPEEDGIINIVPDNGDTLLDQAETELVHNFVPALYSIGGTVDGPLGTGHGTIAYTVAITGCSDWYKPGVMEYQPNIAPELYEGSAILKTEVCETSDAAARNRQLKIDPELSESRNLTFAADMMSYAVHAFVHPMAIECPVHVQGADGDETYDRIKLMKSLGYEVDIVGHPITNSRLEGSKQDYLMENIENDVGIRDSTKLHIWRMTSYSVVVLISYSTLLQQPLQEEIDFLLANDNLKGLYVLNTPDPETWGAGVDTGLLIIKPDLEEFKRIVSAYITTPFTEEGGWNGEGYDDFEGHLGISGFLAYYFAKNPGYYQKLDRCQYAFDADEPCINVRQSFKDYKAFKIVDGICGNPLHCPYDHPDWSKNKKEACSALHRKYYEYRYKFEEKYFNKVMKQERVGLFKPKSFLGYCAGSGDSNRLSMVGNITPKPEWQQTCPLDITSLDGCPSETFRKPDCSCTEYGEDPCSACPENTYCQRFPLMCIDCSCGFCDSSGAACCDVDGFNSCKSGHGDDENCLRQKNFFPAFPGSSHPCGTEFSRESLPNGCGCKPDRFSPCTYNRDWGNKVDKCFVCTATDFSIGKCTSCIDCIRSCTDTSCIDDAVTERDFVDCLSTIRDATCRESCDGYCMTK